MIRIIFITSFIVIITILSRVKQYIFCLKKKRIHELFLIILRLRLIIIIIDKKLNRQEK